jgi:rhamnopyranosyl-N-acetylglucosaminyl-diphospho-decaprenol beta-1,3/1,4-galactofuranosyltransferase
MPTSPGVGAVIVTFNRKLLLRRCLDAVLSQTLPPKSVVVVDNASTDGTREMLDQEYSERVTRIYMRHNVGSAGGFFTGMRWAKERGADWIWLMDDDGVPASNCLERLTGNGRPDQLDVVSPTVVLIDDPERLAFGFQIGSEVIETVPRLREKSTGNLFKNHINPWNGTLIRASSTDAIGDIKAEMFIWGEEIEYWQRALKHKLRVATALEADFRHPLVRAQIVTVPVLGTLFLPNSDRARLYYRNQGYLAPRQRGYVYALAKAVKYLLFFSVRGKWDQIAPFVSYYVDGMLDRYALSPARSFVFENLRHYEIAPVG